MSPTAIQTAVHEVGVPAGEHFLYGDLAIPPEAIGIVLFAHGSGSSRRSPRNRFVARTLEQRKLATLLIDLLTPFENEVDSQTAEHRFDIPMLSVRLVSIIDWLKRQSETATLPIGLFGASTGAGAALLAAADRPKDVGAVVSRGGRPDLAGPALARVIAPTLLVVGGLDLRVIQVNRDALTRMHGQVRLEIVPGATHLFEEVGALERVAAFAGAWFVDHFKAPVPH